MACFYMALQDVENHLFLKKFRVKITPIPIKAGKTKFINHITNVADKIPVILLETRVNKNSATELLVLISAIAIVGIIEITKSIVVVKIRNSIYETLTSKTCNNIKN